MALMVLTGLASIVIEMALCVPSAPAWGYWVLIFHVAVALELMLLLPFTKFAHSICRPVALLFHSPAGRKALQDA